MFGHMFVPADISQAAGVDSGFVRMSVGIEDVEDIWSDINQALTAVESLLITQS